MGDSFTRLGYNKLNHKLEITRDGIEVTNGNISGSAASTGSFGSVVVADHVLGSLKVKAASNHLQIIDSGNGNTYLNISNNDIKAPASTELNLYSHNTLALKLETDKDARFYGKIGIGKSPSSALDVIGDIRSTGNIIAENYIIS